MIPARSCVVCPRCRVYTDRFGNEMPPGVDVRCPWCGTLATAREWVRAAELDACHACTHPRSAHAAYQTADGKEPEPGKHFVVVPHACVACGCVALDGSREVRVA